MIPYIGCISREDAGLLASLAERSDRILEFGSGASTQIFAEYSPGTVDSVETKVRWVLQTGYNLDRLNIKKRVAFHEYLLFKPSGEYDLIFVDGVDDLRQTFAMKAWPFLSVGGCMAFHDTRRLAPHGESATSDVENVLALIKRYSPEIDNVSFNSCDSNTTCVTKRAPLLYENWQVAEGRTDAQMGLE